MRPGFAGNKVLNLKICVHLCSSVSQNGNSYTMYLLFLKFNSSKKGAIGIHFHVLGYFTSRFSEWSPCEGCV